MRNKAVLLLSIVAAALGVTVVALLLRGPSSGPGTVVPRGRTILYYRNPMNPAQTSPTPRKAPDGMDFVPIYAGDGDAISSDGGIRIDPRALQNMGVEVSAVERRTLSKVIRTVGKVDYDETRLYEITTRVSGYIDKLYINFTGQGVSKNEPLLEIYSPDVVSAEQEYLTALRATQITSAPPGEIESAQRLLTSARRRLDLWDIPEHEIREIGESGAPRRTVMLHSPVNGIVIEKLVLKGSAVQPGMKLFGIADLTRVWVQADIYEYELPWIGVGQEAEVELSYLPGEVFRGRVVYIDPALSPMTRTARVRVELPNPGGRIVLRPNMYATVKLLSPPLNDVLAVPDRAVIRSGERTLVVLALAGGRFASREVRLGVVADTLVQVVEGVAAGDRIVTSGQFLIDSESNLRAAIKTIAPPAPPSGRTGTAPPGTRPPLEEMPGMPGMSAESGQPAHSDSAAGHRR